MISEALWNIPKKRQRSASYSGDDSEPELTSSIVRRSITLLTAISDLPTASFSPLLSSLTEAYQSALLAEGLAAKGRRQRAEDWDWQLSPEQIAGLGEEERGIWKAFLMCRESLRFSGIKVHPFNYSMPVVDLRQWEAHIPGTTGTPWEGGVYTLSITFGPDFTKYVPKLRFVRPLFHPNAYPTGTWGYTTEDHKIVTKDMPALWKQTDQQDPLRLATLLRSVMTSLHNPDITDPSQSDAYTMLKNDPKAYAAKIMAQALVWKPDSRTGLAGRPILQL